MYNKQFSAGGQIANGVLFQ